MGKIVISWDYGLRLLDNDYLVSQLMEKKDELKNFNWEYRLVPNSHGGYYKDKDPDSIDEHYDWLTKVIPELENMCKERGIDFEKEIAERSVIRAIQDVAVDIVNSYDWTMPKYNREEYDSYDEYENDCLDIGHDRRSEICGIVISRLVENGTLVAGDDSYFEIIDEEVWDIVTNNIIKHQDEELSTIDRLVVDAVARSKEEVCDKINKESYVKE